MTTLKEGQVWVGADFKTTNLEVSYQILAIWDRFAWVLVYGTTAGSVKEPRTMPVDWFTAEKTYHLKYDVPLSLG